MMSDSSEDFLLPYSRPEEVLPEYRRLFIGRPDVYAVQQTDGSYRLARQPLSDSVLLAHLAGRISVGTYLITPEDDTCRMVVLDVDFRLIRMALALIKSARQIGFDDHEFLMVSVIS